MNAPALSERQAQPAPRRRLASVELERPYRKQRLHAARPDVLAAAHSHSLYGKAWSALGRLSIRSFE